jgi:mevalonate kinase
LRAHVSIELISEKKIVIEASDFQIKEQFPLGKEIKLEKNSPIFPIFKCCQLMVKKFNINSGMKLRIWSEIPPSAGLGSSAAISVATVKAIESVFVLNLTNEEISSNAYEIEKLVHFKPSGIDNHICTHGGCMIYLKGKFEKIEIPKNLPFIICNSQISRNTGTLVEKVANLHEMFPYVTNKIFETIDQISLNALAALKSGDLKKLGILFNLNQGLLDALGVSTPELSKLITIARENGAHGSKLTGAGGGGCIIAVSPPDKQDNIIIELKKSDAAPFTTKFSQDGVRLDSKDMP